MKYLALALVLMFAASPAIADKEAVLKTRDLAVKLKNQAIETYAQDHLQAQIERIETTLMRKARQGDEIIETTVYLDGQDRKLVPGVTKHFVDEGWKVKDVSLHTTWSDWAILYICE